MRPFATYIEYLLMTRHYCYVPGRGAYMLAEEPARFTMADSQSAGQSLFTAPRRVVRFSSLHYHDDGLLANLLMEAEGMTYDEACRYIERQAPLLGDQFLNDAALHTDIDNFGFDDLRLDTWAAIERKKAQAAAPVIPLPAAKAEAEAGDRDTIAIPKYWLRRAVAIVLIGICFFANFIGLNERESKEQLAAIFSVSMFRSASDLTSQSWEEMDDEMLDAEIAAFDQALLAAEDATDADLLADPLATSADADLLAMTEAVPVPDASPSGPTSAAAPKSPAAPIAPAPALDPTKWNESLPMRNMDSELAMAQSPTGRLYYIIIASCPSEADAQRALGNLHNAGYDNVGVLERDGRFRLYVNFFALKSEADAYISKLRQIERFHDAWMLPVRDGSLSHNIKNTYNDNQLSMELSHLNQRTERDQG